MKNYQAVKQWASTVNLDDAVNEITALKAKYPWLKLDKTTATILKLSADLPKVVDIITHQDKQLAIEKEFIRVSGIADTAITNAIIAKFDLKV